MAGGALHGGALAALTGCGVLVGAGDRSSTTPIRPSKVTFGLDGVRAGVGAGVGVGVGVGAGREDDDDDA